jgi:hypothetical protein
MIKRPFEFDLFRLHTLDQSNLFNLDHKSIQSDDDIADIIKQAASREFDRERKSGRTKYRWSLSDFCSQTVITPVVRPLISVTFARSMVTRIGPTVTDSGIQDGTLSESTPPLAIPICLLFDMKRHLVAVEFHSAVAASDVWRATLHEIFDAAATSLRFRSSVRLEAVPETAAILGAFVSFSRLTRLRLTLRLPNPELTRFTRRLKEEMETGGIREYRQDMSNPSGLSQSDAALPFAAAAMAQDGYKVGEVLMQGIINGKQKTIRTGKHAARGKVEIPKDVVHEAVSSLSTESQPALASVLAEVDQIKPHDTTEADSAKAPESPIARRRTGNRHPKVTNGHRDDT